MFCGKCGNKVKDGVKFCPKCGNKFEFKEDVNLNRNERNSKDIGDCIEEDFKNSNADGLIEINLHKKVEKSSIGTRILSIFLCILFFIFSVTAVLVGISRCVLEEEKIRDLCSEIDVVQVNVNYNNQNIGIAEFILEVASDEIISKYNLTESRVNEIIDNDIIKDHFENILVDYIGFIAFGKESEHLSASGIIEIIQDCSQIIYDETGYIFTENDYQELENELNNGSMKFLTISGIENWYISIISMLLSLPMFIIWIALSIVMLVLILLINKWKFKYLCAYIGMTLSVEGSILILGYLAMLIFSWFNELYLVDIIINSVSLYVLLSGLCLVTVGLILFIIYRKAFKRNIY